MIIPACLLAWSFQTCFNRENESGQNRNGYGFPSNENRRSWLWRHHSVTLFANWCLRVASASGTGSLSPKMKFVCNVWSCQSHNLRFWSLPAHSASDSRTTAASPTNQPMHLAIKTNLHARQKKIRIMVVATPRPSVTESAAAAAVLADIDVSSCGRDDDIVTVVSDSSNPRDSLPLDVADDWRNEDADRPLRRQMAIKM